jgi:hypothetical protein
MSNELLTPHFSLSEFVVSRTARNHGVNNTPPPEAVENLRALCVHTLEPLRMALDLPIIITSGYRTKQLNHLLTYHSVKSQHMNGQAADFYVAQAPVSGFRFQVSGPKGLVSGFKKLVQSSKNLVQGSKFKVQGGTDGPGSKNLVQENEKSEVGGLKAEDTTFNSQLPLRSRVPLATPSAFSIFNSLKLETPRQRLIRAFRLIILDESIDYDQLIIYPSFIHVSYVSRERNRRRLTKANGQGSFCALSRAQALKLI